MVYVIQEQLGKNILPASAYGKLEVLLPAGAQVSFSAGAVTKTLRSKLTAFSDEDYLLLIGDPVAIGIAAAAAASWNRGRVKMLKWDRMSSKYFPVQMDLYPKGESANDKLA